MECRDLAICSASQMKHSKSRWCECGNSKSVGAEACDRCTYLDGTRAEALAIAALRRDGQSLDTDQLVAETGCARETIYRMVKRMMAAGRVRRFEGDISEITNAFKWKYALTEAA